MLIVVPDTNVLISAFVFGGKPRQIFDLALKGELTLAISDTILQEFRGVLQGKKFRFSAEDIQTITEETIGLCLHVFPSVTLDVVQNDPDDNRVLECALEAEADFIVSGDSDLLALKEYEGIPILNPQQFLKVYET